jgi:hypothetical protein
MKKSAVIAAFLLFALGCLSAQSIADFDRIATFDIGLKDLAASGSIENRLMFWQGAIDKLEIVSAEGEPLKIRLVMMSSEWLSPSKIVSYKAVVYFSGEEFRPLFALDKSAPLTAIFEKNKVFLLTKMTGFETVDGQKYPLMQGYEILKM